uniref:Glycosyl hydrolases family 38 C-terminal domain-containing protein n=1 Tax=Knipowitschia caucasica TaxID=637954 RepID=A0AAV2LMI0_KNICA
MCFTDCKLFSTLQIVGYSELNLSANQWKHDMKRFDWTPKTGAEQEQEERKKESVWEVTLRPMEIRTFLLRLQI